MTAPAFQLTIEDGHFRDSHGRQVLIRGINVAGDAKFPSDPDLSSYVGDGFFDGDSVQFHARPFPVSEAHEHFSRLRRYGYNSLRYVFTWEAIEAAGPGRYDETWVQHTIDVLRIAGKHGFYVFMDPHQDVVCVFDLSRCTIELTEAVRSGLDSQVAPALPCGRYTPVA
ncbi:cellulase family glycosylhydrolase [Candidatus Bathyarchaeota archaeon]|nr:cellulase family glycosylhydrolase [Candidatus Bathyarchaeota archaeon]